MWLSRCSTVCVEDRLRLAVDSVQVVCVALKLAISNASCGDCWSGPSLFSSEGRAFADIFIELALYFAMIIDVLIHNHHTHITHLRGLGVLGLWGLGPWPLSLRGARRVTRSVESGWG